MCFGGGERGITGFDGAIDELKIYNRGLSAEEVSLLYESEKIPDIFKVVKVSTAGSGTVDIKNQHKKYSQPVAKNNLILDMPFDGSFRIMQKTIKNGNLLVKMQLVQIDLKKRIERGLLSLRKGMLNYNTIQVALLREEVPIVIEDRTLSFWLKKMSLLFRHIFHRGATSC